MNAVSWILAGLLMGLLVSAVPQATPDHAGNEELLYMLYCRGCHTPDGTGGAGVPRIRDHIGTFLQSQEGREYLVRVPGASTSILSDAELAGVTNWMILNFGGASIPSEFKPYAAEEVGLLRQSPLNELVNYRRGILARIEAARAEGSPPSFD